MGDIFLLDRRGGVCHGPDMTPDAVPGLPEATGRWMTYQELAEARGISKASAERMARRHKWTRRPGNDRTARVLVPPDALEPVQGKPGGQSAPDIDALRQSFDTALGAVLVRAERAERRAESLEQANDALRRQLEAGQGRGRWWRFLACWRGRLMGTTS